MAEDWTIDELLARAEQGLDKEALEGPRHLSKKRAKLCYTVGSNEETIPLTLRFSKEGYELYEREMRRLGVPLSASYFFDYFLTKGMTKAFIKKFEKHLKKRYLAYLKTKNTSTLIKNRVSRRLRHNINVTEDRHAHFRYQRSTPFTLESPKEGSKKSQSPN